MDKMQVIELIIANMRRRHAFYQIIENKVMQDLIKSFLKVDNSFYSFYEKYFYYVECEEIKNDIQKACTSVLLCMYEEED